MAHEFTELEESNRQIIETWKSFVRGSERCAIVESDGIATVFSHYSMPFLNFVFLTSPVNDVGDFERRVRRAVSYGNDASVPWMLVLCDDWLPAADSSRRDEVLSRVGLHAVMPMTGMVTETLQTSDNASELTFRRVIDAETRRAVSDINCIAYEIPLEMGRASIALEEFWRTETFTYLGCVGEKPVTCASIWITDGILYVALVATLPEHRKKGYAEAVMRHALHEAKEATGIRRTALHASNAGLPIYERMGYRTVATFTCYAPAH